MNEVTRRAVALALGVGFVVWQSSKGPDRAFAAVLAVAAIGYAFAPVIRHGATG